MIRAVNDLDVAGKRLVVRADLNVPMDGGRVSDANRITRFADGMKPLIEAGAALVILSHFGRPKGKPDPALSLAQLQAPLADALGVPVGFATLGEAVGAANGLAPGQVLLVENLRFEPGEEANDADFARHLASLGEVYVNDAFSCTHRAHTSTEAIARLLPADACPEEAMILDAGPQSVAAFTRVLEEVRTILWNGPLGAFEMPPFDTATVALAKVAADLTRGGSCVSIAGGGDTVAALNGAGVADSFTYVSSAGGAFLEWLEGHPLPGVAALQQQEEV